jgi:hypothetical protein
MKKIPYTPGPKHLIPKDVPRAGYGIRLVKPRRVVRVCAYGKTQKSLRYTVVLEMRRKKGTSVLKFGLTGEAMKAFADCATFATHEWQGKMIGT